MLRIIVSIKQVPDADDLRVDPITNTLVREGVPAVVNPPDLHAIEEGVRLKERYGGKVTVITMGPPQGESALRDALAMGADEAYLITDRSMAGADTWATSYTISRAVQKLGGADLYLFGRRAVDGETEQVGPQTAKWLGIPVVGYVSEVREVKERSVVVVKSTESLEEVLEVPLPAVLTILETANKPRQPDINSLIRARTAKIPKLTREDIGAEPNKVGLAGSPTKVIKVQPPPKTRNPEIKYVGKDQDVIDWASTEDKGVPDRGLWTVTQVRETQTQGQDREGGLGVRGPRGRGTQPGLLGDHGGGQEDSRPHVNLPIGGGDRG
jgi:Electron transfer flavoprotein, beta subunit